MKTITLRGHHLLCTRLFEGHGYDEGFTLRMGEVVSRMGLTRYNGMEYPKAERVRLICGSDYVCMQCPNQMADGNSDKSHSCALGTEDVLKKDRLTLKYTGLEENREYTLSEIEAAMEKIDKEQFDEICTTCRWHRKGYCSYDKLAREYG